MNAQNTNDTRLRYIKRLEEPPVAQSLFGDVRWSWLWLILRLYLGYEWLSAGLGKISSPAWTGANAGSALTGFVNGALTQTSGAHPNVQGWYAWFLQNVVLPNAAVWAIVVAVGETLVGIALILGIFTGIAAVEPLMQVCTHSDHRLLWEMCKTLSQIGDPASVPVFLKALENKHFEIRWMGAEGLIAIGRKNPEHLKALLHALLQHPNSTWLREGAHHVFHDLLVYDHRPEFKELVAALSDFDWTARTPAAIDRVLNELADE